MPLESYRSRKSPIDSFDQAKIYVSHEIGARKPEAAAFRAVVADMGMAPQRILFFDDIAENVAGARACGVRAVQVKTAGDVERALEDMVWRRG